MSTDLTVIIITLNEELHIERAIGSLASYPGLVNVFVIDAGSTDRTRELATNCGAYVVTHEFETHARQINWALDNLLIRTDWVMRIDADEVLYPETLQNIHKVIERRIPNINGLLLNRRHIFENRWVRHGGRYPLWLLRAWKVGSARVEDRRMDEHIVLSRGDSLRVHGRFEDRNLSSLTEFIRKHDRYATMEALDRIADEQTPEPRLSGHRNRIKRFLKVRFYNNLPGSFGPWFYFLWRMFVQAGVLDGPEGRRYHFLQGLWYRVLVEGKVHELRSRGLGR